MDEGFRVGRPRSTQPVPDDFRQYARREGDLKLKARYRVGRPVILRWRAETGLWCGAKRDASRSTARPLTTQAKRARKRYAVIPMHEISWYDAQEDADTFASATGIRFGFDD